MNWQITLTLNSIIWAFTLMVITGMRSGKTK
jgi:hypothetical protein